MFSPRFGFAYAATNKTVIRGGYGMFFARPQGNMIFSQVNVPPILLVSQFENGNLANPGGAAGVLAPNGNITAIDPKVVNGYYGAVQPGRAARIAEGHFRRGLLRRQPGPPPAATAQHQPDSIRPQRRQRRPCPRRSAPPTPPWFPIRATPTSPSTVSDSTSNYHALQAYLNKRKGNIFFTAGYTYSKAMGDSSGQGDNPENYLDRHYNYGPLSFDRRHAFVATYVWSLPRLGRQNADRARRIRLVAAQRRYPAADRPVLHGHRQHFDRRTPRRLRGRRYSGCRRARSINNWVNRAAFANAPDNRFGNSPVGNVEAPGLQTYNLSVSKNFQIHERFRLRYQADFFNAFNIV